MTIEIFKAVNESGDMLYVSDDKYDVIDYIKKHPGCRCEQGYGAYNRTKGEWVLLADATKKAKGRPSNEAYYRARQLNNLNCCDNADSVRVVQNKSNIADIECFLMDILEEYGDTAELSKVYHFFHTTEGRTRRAGILEQLGRMLNSGLFQSEEHIIKTVNSCIYAYECGLDCKMIEKLLRKKRLEAVKAKKAGIETSENYFLIVDSTNQKRDAGQ